WRDLAGSAGEGGGTFAVGRGAALAALGRPALLDQANRLAHAIAQEVKLGPAGFAAALHRERLDRRRMHREDALHTLVADDAPDGEGLIDPSPLAHDDRAGEDLDALLVAFDDADGHIHRVADAELRYFLLHTGFFNGVDEWVTHGSLQSVEKL